MTKKDDGGQTFPHSDDAPVVPWQGMTLRDWFAGQALTGIMAARRPDPYSGFTPTISAQAYALADAMLKARDADD